MTDTDWNLVFSRCDLSVEDHRHFPTEYVDQRHAHPFCEHQFNLDCRIIVCWIRMDRCDWSLSSWCIPDRLKFDSFGNRMDIPNPGGGIPTCRCYLTSVWTPGDSIDPVSMTDERLEHSTTLSIPYLDRLVGACSRQFATIWTPGNPKDIGCMSYERLKRLSS